MQQERRLPIGAELTSQGVNFRVYAPLCKQVEVSLEDQEPFQFFPLKSEENGYFSATLTQFKEGSKYRFRLNQESDLYADPASRYQPEGPFGPSQVVDHTSYQWTDQEWKGVKIGGQIIYEMHIATFTPEGTLRAAMAELPNLVDLGVTVIELMPLNDFSGKFGWGYDGVNLFAPTRLYGTPDDVRAFINEAHRLSLAVILDVVYNHFGPEGNFLSRFADTYFHTHNTEWGQAINFDHIDTRIFFLSNVRYWIEEFHFDGLRVDATHAIECNTSPHILFELQRVARKAASSRDIIVIGENEAQTSTIARSPQLGGYGFDALWNDDFHHSAMVRLTGKRQAYYTDYLGTPQEFISSVRYGYLYQGQYYAWQQKHRGEPCLDLPASSFVLYIQNHDQIANNGYGQRVHELTGIGHLKALTCLFLLAPGVPMLFQGQEFASSSPFFYFADHKESLAKCVDSGRKEFLSQFRNLANEEAIAYLPNPCDPLTFSRCKLDLSEREKNVKIYQLHKDLIALRKNDPTFSQINPRVEGAILNENAFILRYIDTEHRQDRLLLMNLGVEFSLYPMPEPLLAPPYLSSWKILWSSESLDYGGQGTPPLEGSVWAIPGHCALILGIS